MGEMAEAMLDGTFCEGCGEAFDDIMDGADAPGFPRRCASCQANLDGRAPLQPRRKSQPVPPKKGLRCHICGKICRGPQGLADHKRNVHRAKNAAA